MKRNHLGKNCAINFCMQKNQEFSLLLATIRQTTLKNGRKIAVMVDYS